MRKHKVVLDGERIWNVGRPVFGMHLSYYGKVVVVYDIMSLVCVGLVFPPNCWLDELFMLSFMISRTLVFNK